MKLYFHYSSFYWTNLILQWFPLFRYFHLFNLFLVDHGVLQIGSEQSTCVDSIQLWVAPTRCYGRLGWWFGSGIGLLGLQGRSFFSCTFQINFLILPHICPFNRIKFVFAGFSHWNPVILRLWFVVDEILSPFPSNIQLIYIVRVVYPRFFQYSILCTLVRMI